MTTHFLLLALHLSFQSAFCLLGGSPAALGPLPGGRFSKPAAVTASRPGNLKAGSWVAGRLPHFLGLPGGGVIFTRLALKSRKGTWVPW